MSKSIMQDKAGGECYLCKRLLGIDTPAACREEHHVMHGMANRKLSEHYGLKVYLCPYHHRTGPGAVHTCKQTDLYLKQDAQRAFKQKYSHERWMKVFGRNYLEPGEPDSPRRPAAGPSESPRLAAGQEPTATSKNQQNKPFSQVNISQNTPEGFHFIDQQEDGIPERRIN